YRHRARRIHRNYPPAQRLHSVRRRDPCAATAAEHAVVEYLLAVHPRRSWTSPPALTFQFATRLVSALADLMLRRSRGLPDRTRAVRPQALRSPILWHRR